MNTTAITVLYEWCFWIFWLYIVPIPINYIIDRIRYKKYSQTPYPVLWFTPVINLFRPIALFLEWAQNFNIFNELWWKDRWDK